MLLSEEHLDLLKGDLDYILARTKCNSIQITRGQVANALERDPDVLLDLVEGMPDSEARWLSVPQDVIRSLIQRRSRGATGGHGAAQEQGGLVLSV